MRGLLASFSREGAGYWIDDRPVSSEEWFAAMDRAVEAAERRQGAPRAEHAIELGPAS